MSPQHPTGKMGRAAVRRSSNDPILSGSRIAAHEAASIAVTAIKPIERESRPLSFVAKDTPSLNENTIGQKCTVAVTHFNADRKK